MDIEATHDLALVLIDRPIRNSGSISIPICNHLIPTYLLHTVQLASCGLGIASPEKDDPIYPSRLQVVASLTCSTCCLEKLDETISRYGHRRFGSYVGINTRN